LNNHGLWEMFMKSLYVSIGVPVLAAMFALCLILVSCGQDEIFDLPYTSDNGMIDQLNSSGLGEAEKIMKSCFNNGIPKLDGCEYDLYIPGDDPGPEPGPGPEPEPPGGDPSSSSGNPEPPPPSSASVPTPSSSSPAPNPSSSSPAPAASSSGGTPAGSSSSRPPSSSATAVAPSSAGVAPSSSATVVVPSSPSGTCGAGSTYDNSEAGKVQNDDSKKEMKIGGCYNMTVTCNKDGWNNSTNSASGLPLILNSENGNGSSWTGTIYCSGGSSKSLTCDKAKCESNACPAGTTGAWLSITAVTGNASARADCY
jgi:hypothetical protein